MNVFFFSLFSHCFPGRICSHCFGFNWASTVNNGLQRNSALNSGYFFSALEKDQIWHNAWAEYFCVMLLTGCWWSSSSQWKVSNSRELFSKIHTALIISRISENLLDETSCTWDQLKMYQIMVLPVDTRHHAISIFILRSLQNPFHF